MVAVLKTYQPDKIYNYWRQIIKVESIPFFIRSGWPSLYGSQRHDGGNISPGTLWCSNEPHGQKSQQFQTSRYGQGRCSKWVEQYLYSWCFFGHLSSIVILTTNLDSFFTFNLNVFNLFLLFSDSFRVLKCIQNEILLAWQKYPWMLEWSLFLWIQK